MQTYKGYTIGKNHTTGMLVVRHHSNWVGAVNTEAEARSLIDFHATPGWTW